MSRRIARPYATALFRALEPEGNPALEAAAQGLHAVTRVFAGTPGLLRVFEVPTVSLSEKRTLIGSISSAVGARPEVARLLVLMTEHLRLRILDEVLEAFRALIDRKAGVLRGHLVVPATLPAGRVEALSAALTQLLGAQVRLETTLDPSLLAGFVVRVGSQVYDGSLDAQLRRFAAQAAAQ